MVQNKKTPANAGVFLWLVFNNFYLLEIGALLDEKELRWLELDELS